MAAYMKICPLMSLPVELRLRIFSYMLPLARNGTASLIVNIRKQNGKKLGYETSPYPYSLRRYLAGIAFVSRTIREECLTVFYDRPLNMKIDTWSFRTIDHRYRCCGSGSASWGFDCEDCTQRELVWDLLPTFDWRRVREFRLMIDPSENIDGFDHVSSFYHGFWKYAPAAVEGLVAWGMARKLGAGALQKFSIWIKDRTRSTNEWDGNVRPLRAIVYDPKEDVPEHILQVLKPFRKMLRTKAKLDVKLPEWALEDEGLVKFVEELKEAIHERVEPDDADHQLQDTAPPLESQDDEEQDECTRFLAQIRLAYFYKEKNLWRKVNSWDEDAWYWPAFLPWSDNAPWNINAKPYINQ